MGLTLSHSTNIADRRLSRVQRNLNDQAKKASKMKNSNLTAIFDKQAIEIYNQRVALADHEASYKAIQYRAMGRMREAIKHEKKAAEMKLRYFSTETFTLQKLPATQTQSQSFSSVAHSNIQPAASPASRTLSPFNNSPSSSLTFADLQFDLPPSYEMIQPLHTPPRQLHAPPQPSAPVEIPNEVNYVKPVYTPRPQPVQRQESFSCQVTQQEGRIVMLSASN